GGLLIARDYLQHRLTNTEDRYMALYGQEEWSASNMDLTLHADPTEDEALKSAFRERLGAYLLSGDEGAKLLRERTDPHARTLSFVEDRGVGVDELMQPRQGVYFDLSRPGQIRAVWNHMQTDGVGMWNTLRPLFDENPPIVPFKDVPTPPPFLPELLALPRVARRLAWRGRLRREAEGTAPLTRGLVCWDTAPIRAMKEQTGAPFNLLTSALAVRAVFQRHPEKDRLNVGLTAYFPFMKGRNRYSVFLCRVRRAEVDGIVRQLHRQVRSPMLNWGASSAQAYALGRVPDKLFSEIVGYYRRQIDVLISSLPVGQKPVTLAGMRTLISCHPWELTLPYYFLLVGTRQELNVSYTSRFPQDDGFLSL
ncbi:MAG: hypothetical protein ACI8S6_003569, partial [Myxococcota bacterium]